MYLDSPVCLVASAKAKPPPRRRITPQGRRFSTEKIILQDWPGRVKYSRNSRLCQPSIGCISIQERAKRPVFQSRRRSEFEEKLHFLRMWRIKLGCWPSTALLGEITLNTHNPPLALSNTFSPSEPPWGPFHFSFAMDLTLEAGRWWQL